MSGFIDISVIIPYGYYSPDLMETLRSATLESDHIEIILVTNHMLRKRQARQLEGVCKIVESEQIGRGYYCSTGTKAAQGSIVLFLHADTILPAGWDQKILATLSDTSVAGGGFTTQFRTDHWFVKRISKLYNLFSLSIHEFWGDRALFMRRKDLMANLDNIELPMMEDIEMSKIMRKKGKMVLLPDVVSTSSLHFTIKGHFCHIAGALYYRMLYALGVSAERIHASYYKKFEL